MSQFVHLHCHSEYSLLDGMSRLSDMALRAKELDQPAIALTDHGVMFGAIEFYNACKKAGVKPIMGMEAYLAARRMQDRDSQLDRERFHLLLLAQNQTGYGNLLKLASVAQLEGFYGRPRVDREVLAEHSEGVIATTGCLAAEVPRRLMRGDEAGALERLKWYLDVFGRDRFFLELQGHEIDELRRVNSTLLQWARKYEIGLVATNDVHYVRKEDARPHDILLCVQTGDPISKQGRMQLNPMGSYYLTTAEEMQALFGDYPEALANTLKIAEMCEVNLDSQGYHLPIFPLPDGYDAESYLRALVEQGLVERYGPERAKNDAIVRERVERELGIIHNMGFDNYFLIVWDLCAYAASEDIWWNVRGSGAGSVVAYTLKITSIDPIKNDLIFERFLNPARVSMPDIDIDFPDDKRGDMIEYAVRKYGSDRVAAIITFGTLGARAAVRDVARALEVPLTEADRLARMIPAVPGKPVHLDKLLFDEATAEEWPMEAQEIRAAYAADPTAKELLDTAVKLEGLARHASTHAAGIVISDKPIVEYCPLHRPTKGDDEGPVRQVTQFPMAVVESIGLLKVDFLGLATLTIMRTACELIEQRHGRKLNLSNIPYERRPDDPRQDADVLKAFNLLQEGHTVGVFQVEGAGMKRVLTEMKPSEFEHIIAVISLYRPGPMEYIPTYIARMHGKEPVTYHHPALKPILENTYGILVYQEQIMRVASELGGYSPGEADLMRRAVSKKKAKDIEHHKGIFVQGAVERGIPQEAAERIYADIEFFARYGFNKSHAADYAVITVQTAYLKAHYPVEYMCALLRVEFDDTDKVPVFIQECRRLGIPILQPDINKSGVLFTIEPNPEGAHLPEGEPGHWAIRFGMGAIKNVGVSAVETILAEREAAGPFRDIDDFCERVDLRQINRRVLECLIKVGCFDDLVAGAISEAPRETLLAVVDRMVGVSGQTHAAAESGQLSLFDLMGGATAGVPARGSVLMPLPRVGEVNPKQRLQDEKELLGVFVSDHPLQQVATAVGRGTTHSISDLNTELIGQQVVIAGLLSSIRNYLTSTKQEPMAWIKLEDFGGEVEVTVFPRTYAQCRATLQIDNILLIRGKVEASRRAGDDDKVQLIADEVILFQAEGANLILEEPAPVFEFAAPTFVGTPPPPEPPPFGDGAAAGNDTTTGLLAALKHHIKITLRRTEDERQDLRLFQQVMQVVQSFPGDDRISLVLAQPHGREVQLEFPNVTTGYCAALRDTLNGFNVEVEVSQVEQENGRKRWKSNGA